jgi:hypothetical protein
LVANNPIPAHKNFSRFCYQTATPTGFNAKSPHLFQKPTNRKVMHIVRFVRNMICPILLFSGGLCAQTARNNFDLYSIAIKKHLEYYQKGPMPTDTLFISEEVLTIIDSSKLEELSGVRILRYEEIKAHKRKGYHLVNFYQLQLDSDTAKITAVDFGVSFYSDKFHYTRNMASRYAFVFSADDRLWHFHNEQHSDCIL